MPELPEVETTRRSIAPHIVDQSITQVVIRNAQLRWPIPNNLGDVLIGLTIHAVTRRAKYLLVDCGAGTLVMHLGMSGSLRILLRTDEAPLDYLPQKHDHFELVLNNQTILRYRDPRRFGAILWCADDIQNFPLLAKLGVEPLTDALDGKYLFERTRGRNTSIKDVLMNSHIVVGVGNIYANEALFHANIHPRTASKRVGMERCERLVQAIKKTLQQAIEAGGSTLRDFVNGNGQPGYFQQQYWVYGRNGQACKKCDVMIKQIKQSQRSSFYCPSCQR